MPSEQHSTLICTQCGTHLAPAALMCPGCGRLVHSARLKELAAAANRAEEADHPTAALEAWNNALSLLPPDSRQFQTVAERVSALGRVVDALPQGHAPAPPESAGDAAKGGASGKSTWAKGASGVGVVALLLWKFKFVLTFILTKGKLLLLGLTKAGTFTSMLLSMGVYWAAFGWRFAVGLVISIYIHEMGHVAALRRYGIHASAPMFIPGLGAFIRLKQRMPDPRQDARVGLAGPLWGLGAAIAAYLVFLGTGWASWAAIARIGAWINLFNLMPIWQLDGGRGFESMTRTQRWWAVAAIATAWFFIEDGMLVLILIMAIIRACAQSKAKEPDQVCLVQYIFLIAVLSAMSTLEVPIGADF